VPPTTNTCDAGTWLAPIASSTTVGKLAVRVNRIAVRPDTPPPSKNPARPDAAKPSGNSSPVTTIKRSRPVKDPPPTRRATSTDVTYLSGPEIRCTVAVAADTPAGSLEGVDTATSADATAGEPPAPARNAITPSPKTPIIIDIAAMDA
jgi:hypothetical protein